MATGKVVINEYNYAGNYLELKINDRSVLASTSNFNDWKLSHFKKSGSGFSRADYSVQSAYTDGAGCGTSSNYIKFPIGSIGNDSVVVLWSNSAMTDEVDYFRVGQSAYPTYKATSCFAASELPSASTVTYHQAALTGSSARKDIARAPDGSGIWIETPYNGSDQGTLCTTNDSTLSITKVRTSAASSIYVGEQATFRVTVTLNSRAGTQSSVVVNDLLPSGLAYVSHTASTGTYNSGTGVWSIGSLAAGASVTLNVTAKATLVGTLTNSATVSSTDFPSGTVAAATATVTGLQPLTLTKTVSPSSVGFNTAATYTVTVTNNSTAALPAAFTVNDTAPAGLTVGSISASSGSSYSGGVWTINSGMAAGTSKTLTIPVTSQTTAGSFTNTATAVAPFGGANLTASAILTVTAAATSSFSAYETSVSNANAATVANRIIQTRVATTSGNLCKADGSTCNLTVAGFTSTPAVDTGYGGTVTASLEYCGNVSRSGSGTSSTVSCSGSWTALGSTQNVSLTSGVGTLTLPFVNNAYEVVRVKLTNTSPSGTWYSDDYFAIRPSALSVTAIDATSSTAGNTRSLTSGANSHKAEQPFTLNAQALASAATASNYKGTGEGPVTKSVTTTSPTGTGLVNGTLTPGTWSSSGTLTSSTASYSEVGTFTLTLEDQDYANIDKVDGSSTSDRYFSGSASLGRFTPDHFQTVVTKACSSFTYSGQPFTVTTTALNAANNPTLNYSLTNNTVTLSDAGVITNLTSNTVASSSFSVTTGIATSTPTYTFASAKTAPATITIRATDVDSITSTDYETSAGNTIYSGRLRLQNAYGSELLNLPIPLEAQYWNGSTYVRNLLDSCSTISANSIAMGNYKNNLAACETQVGYSSGTGAFVAGVSSFLRLTKPGATNSGSVDLTINLNGASGNTCTSATTSAATNANMPWFGSNPLSRATFGVYKTPIIYLRENY